MALSLGPDGITLLQPGQWQIGSSLRYLYADEGWRGSHYWPDYATIVGNQITIVSVDTQLTYAFTSRLSATLTVPYQYGQTSNYAEHDGTRHTVNAHGIGDVRLVGTVWLLDPATHGNGNVSLGVGLKMPTGDDAATSIFHKPTGLQTRPVDVSIQPGDGGWGATLELAAYRKLSDRLYVYANGYYLINPRETNSGYPPNAAPGTVWNSVSDQYLLRTGLSVTRWPSPQLSVSLGMRINGVPAFDVVGGSEGFRRPGYVTYIEPGVTWTSGRNEFSLFVPLRIDANRIRNVSERRSNVDGGGAFARYLVVTSFSHKF
ncbi:MAG: hypothetical protein ABIZ04_17150 [Opitutus sp.]